MVISKRFILLLTLLSSTLASSVGKQQMNGQPVLSQEESLAKREKTPEVQKAYDISLAWV
jgi:hypothetical protein